MCSHPPITARGVLIIVSIVAISYALGAPGHELLRDSFHDIARGVLIIVLIIGRLACLSICPGSA